MVLSASNSTSDEGQAVTTASPLDALHSQTKAYLIYMLEQYTREELELIVGQYEKRKRFCREYAQLPRVKERRKQSSMKYNAKPENKERKHKLYEEKKLAWKLYKDSLK